MAVKASALVVCGARKGKTVAGTMGLSWDEVDGVARRGVGRGLA